MTSTLAVCVPVLGLPSETFIRRHVEALAPGASVVIARRRAPDGPGTWTTDAPTLLLDDLLDDWGGEKERNAVTEFLRRHGVGSVLVEFLDIWLPFLPVFEQAEVRCVAHGHGYDISSRLRDARWREAYLAYRDIDAVVVPSGYARRQLMAPGLAPDLVHVVPYGVDLPPTRCSSHAPPTAVVAVGRLVAKKDPLTTLDACRRAVAAGADLRLTFVGDGPLMSELRAAVSATRLPVELLGAQPNSVVHEILATSDIFCQHSRVDPATGDEEGVPVGILEAMAHGLPVVSTRHAGIPEAVVAGVTGLLGAEGDVDAMAAHILALCNDAGLRERMGTAGRDRVQGMFSWAREREDLLALLGLGEHDVAPASGGPLA